MNGVLKSAFIPLIDPTHSCESPYNKLFTPIFSLRCTKIKEEYREKNDIAHTNAISTPNPCNDPNGLIQCYCI